MTALIVACLQGAHQFIINVVADTYLRDLKSVQFYYTRVTPMELLGHLQYMCGGLHALDLLTLQSKMQNAHKEYEGIP